MTSGMLVFLVVNFLAVSVFSWASTSHYLFSCESLLDDVTISTISNCVIDSNNLNMFSGSEMPDSFYFGSFITGSECNGYPQLHNLEYAGYQVKLALQEQSSFTNYNVTEFALGYGSHIVADAAGFWPDPVGFLGNGYDENNVHNTSGLYNWIQIWAYMTGIDGYVYNGYMDSNTVISLPSIPIITDEVAQFLVDANNNWKSSPVTLTTSQALSCAREWEKVINVESDKVLNMPSEYFDYELIFGNPYGIDNVTQLEEYFNMARTCAVLGINHWQNIILNPNITPEIAAGDTVAYINTLFSDGKCAPL